jgi:precorrin-8X/cobalt-precorrin-8 methylmutase
VTDKGAECGIEGRKGNAVVAAAIVDGLVDLAWQAYGQDRTGGR